MKCPNCGETKRIRERDKFCHKCGHNLRCAESKASGAISIARVDSRCFLTIGSEQIEVADYNIKSSADGSTELSVVIRGNATLVDISASLMVRQEDVRPLESLKQAVHDVLSENHNPTFKANLNNRTLFEQKLDTGGE